MLVVMMFRRDSDYYDGEDEVSSKDLMIMKLVVLMKIVMKIMCDYSC